MSLVADSYAVLSANPEVGRAGVHDDREVLRRCAHLDGAEVRNVVALNVKAERVVVRRGVGDGQRVSLGSLEVRLGEGLATKVGTGRSCRISACCTSCTGTGRAGRTGACSAGSSAGSTCGSGAALLAALPWLASLGIAVGSLSGRRAMQR